MKKAILLFYGLALAVPLLGQGLDGYQIVVEEESFTGLPGLQSFAWGQSEGKWLIIGGRTDGLHRRQPWASFREEDNNKILYVIDPADKAVWSAELTGLPTSVYEQLQSTNLSFEQRGDVLYIVGGYGYSASAARHVTYPYLTAVDLPKAINAVVNGESPASFFRQIRDERLQVTGGYLGAMDGYFYLVGGQKFMGLYNPMGPNHGPGFVQEYTNQIRKFQIGDEEGQLSIANYSTLTDSLELHRRDYNLAAQVFPDGSLGFTAFSGVFQYEVNLPWLNTVDITANGYFPNHDFNQYLNQYHTAHVSAYDRAHNAMYTIFFGGISRFDLDENGNLIDDQNVPFVRTISQVERDGQGRMRERKIGEMPALLGSGAEFIVQPDLTSYENGVIDLNELTGDNILLGYIFGGIESSGSNIFFLNTGTQSTASNRLFAVRLARNRTTAVDENDRPLRNVTAFPNPSRDGHFTVALELTRQASLTVDLLNQYGSILHSEMINQTLPPGEHQFRLRLHRNAPGLYYLRVYDGNSLQTRKIVRQ